MTDIAALVPNLKPRKVALALIGHAENDRRLPEFVKELGFDVMSAADQKEIVYRAATMQPDFILLSACLERVGNDTGTAQQTLKALKADKKTFKLPVIVVSGNNQDSETEAEFKLLGADGFYYEEEALSVSGGFVKHLRARLLLNVAGRNPVDQSLPHQVRIGKVILHIRDRWLSVPGRARVISLSQAEAKTLASIMTAGGAAVSAMVIYKESFHHFPKKRSSTIKSYVSRLRKKLGKLAQLIISDAGESYRFNVDLAKTLN